MPLETYIGSSPQYKIYVLRLPNRRILMLNHPDKGGSKYMAAKINEAKEILLKGKD